jgi:hypothetical protein
MGFFDSLIGIGKGLYDGDYGAAATSGASLLDTVGPALISAGGQTIANNSVNSALEDAINKIKAQEQADYETALAEYPQKQAAMNAAAAARRQAARQVAALQHAYYKKSQAQLKPFADAALRELPVREKIYSTGMTTLSDALAMAAAGLRK